MGCSAGVCNAFCISLPRASSKRRHSTSLACIGQTMLRESKLLFMVKPGFPFFLLLLEGPIGIIGVQVGAFLVFGHGLVDFLLRGFIQGPKRS